jgi:hypothetical protein
MTSIIEKGVEVKGEYDGQTLHDLMRTRPGLFSDGFHGECKLSPSACRVWAIDKWYMQASAARRILAAASGARNHVCPIPGCGASYTMAAGLAKHDAAVHQG